jgi:hypothetical protein
MKKWVFGTSFKKFAWLAAPAICIALVLIVMPMGYVRTMQYDPMALMFFAPPWGIAFLILLGIGWIYLSNRGKTIAFTRDRLEFQKGRKGFRCRWADLSFTPPPADKKKFRSAVISDGKHYERIDEFFFADFEAIVETIRKARQHSRDLPITLDDRPEDD